MELVLTSLGCLSLFCVGVLIYSLGRHLNEMRMSGNELTPIPPADRYRPMLRLLAEDDFRYLAAGGWTRAMVRRARAERRSLFRVYLRSLVKDYSLLLSGLRMRMVHSSTDRPELARALARNRFLFTCSVMRIELRLALHALGASEVEISGLVQVVELLRSQTMAFQSMTLVPASAAAAG